MNVARWAVMVTVLMAMTACFPVYKTTKPNLEIVLVDSQQQPVTDAAVVLTTWIRPTPIHVQDTQYTNAKGMVNFKKEKDMQTHTLFLHGSFDYLWNLCTEKTGYANFTQTVYESTKRNKPLIVTIVPGESQSCIRKAE